MAGPTLNPFFRNLNYTLEQRLLEDLVIESIQIHGVNLMYMPRVHVNIDELFLQDPLSQFNQALRVEAYIKNFEGWTGEGDLMSKFGISMSDQITFCVAVKRFNQLIGSRVNLIRPQEGDLIFFEIPNALQEDHAKDLRSLFEIKFVEHESVFYSTGALQFYELRCERFNYNSEEFNTGVDDIDEIQAEYSVTTDTFRILTTDGNFLCDTDGNRLIRAEYDPSLIDTTNQNDYLITDANTFISFNERDPFNDF